MSISIKKDDHSEAESVGMARGAACGDKQNHQGQAAGKLMNPARYVAVFMLGIYSAIPAIAALLVIRSARSMGSLALDVSLATLPMLLLAALTWRLTWPRWKLFGKLLIQPCIYLILSIYIHHWSIVVAWLHQGVLGLGVHIWFSRRHGFTWYAVENVERYIHLSKSVVGIESTLKK